MSCFVDKLADGCAFYDLTNSDEARMTQRASMPAKDATLRASASAALRYLARFRCAKSV